MVDLSPYLEEEFNAGGAPSEEKKPDLNIAIPLTPEDKDRLFYDFQKMPDLMATFMGQGQTYSWSGHTIKTWSFKDANGLSWLVPQWEALDIPQDPFKGFKGEDPGEGFVYLMKYHGKDEASGKHNITVFRKRAINRS